MSTSIFYLNSLDDRYANRRLVLAELLATTNARTKFLHTPHTHQITYTRKVGDEIMCISHFSNPLYFLARRLRTSNRNIVVDGASEQYRLLAHHTWNLMKISLLSYLTSLPLCTYFFVSPMSPVSYVPAAIWPFMPLVCVSFLLPRGVQSLPQNPAADRK